MSVGIGFDVLYCIYSTLIWLYCMLLYMVINIKTDLYYIAYIDDIVCEVKVPDVTNDLCTRVLVLVVS